MNCESFTVSSSSQLAALSHEIEQGLSVVLRLDDVTYSRASKGGSSVGAQFRHVIDHINRLLLGLDSGRIDYTNRERDARIEVDRDFGAAALLRLLGELKATRYQAPDEGVLVRSELDPNAWMPSSAAREFEAALSHTVHHHALIAEKLIGMGFECGPQFGVAPSTLAYQAKIAA